MAKVAYPAMSQLGYSDRLTTGAIAGGGALGILNPPSTIMVIYGVLTETNIGKLFAAGILSGILATFLLCLAVQWIVWTDPASVPRSTVLSSEEEEIIVTFRQHTLLPLDEYLYALQATITHLTRSSLHRCLKRHGISRLPEQLAISTSTSPRFAPRREAVIEAVPYKVHTVLTDNGVQFGDMPSRRAGPTARYRLHMFERVCREHVIEHRLTNPNHPWARPCGRI